MKILRINSKLYNGSKSEDLIFSKLLYLCFGLLLPSWFALPRIIGLFDPTAAAVDPSIWMLLIFSLISYFLLLGISVWLLRTIWQVLGLPEMNTLVLKFNNLQSWQQLKFCFALFALLLLSAVGVLAAII